MSEPAEALETAVEIVSATAVESLARGEIDMQIATAKKYPRSVRQFEQIANSLASENEDVAASCYYKLPRDGQTIEGPSVRLAEICAYAWGNLRYGARVIEESDEFLTAQGYAHDVERNTQVFFEVRRKIKTRLGKRYSADMVATTANAACSIALRNAVFRVIPRSYIDRIMRQCQKVARGDERTVEVRRKAALDYFKGLGITKERVLKKLGVAGDSEITLDHLELLGGMRTAVKEEAATAEELFADTATEPVAEATASASKRLAKQIAKQQDPAPEPGSEG